MIRADMWLLSLKSTFFLNAKSSGATVINPASSVRFRKETGLQVPGPGAYREAGGMSKDGK
jgi:hypothetical protein